MGTTYHHQYKKKITRNYPKYSNACSFGICSKVLKNVFEIAVVYKPSVFEPLKFYCNSLLSEKTLSFKSKVHFRKAAA